MKLLFCFLVSSTQIIKQSALNRSFISFPLLILMKQWPIITLIQFAKVHKYSKTCVKRNKKCFSLITFSDGDRPSTSPEQVYEIDLLRVLHQLC